MRIDAMWRCGDRRDDDCHRRRWLRFIERDQHPGWGVRGVNGHEQFLTRTAAGRAGVRNGLQVAVKGLGAPRKAGAVSLDAPLPNATACKRERTFFDYETIGPLVPPVRWTAFAQDVSE